MQQESTQLYDALKTHMSSCIKANNTDELRVIRVMLAEIQRDPNKNYSDFKSSCVLLSLRNKTLKNPVPDTKLLDITNEYIVKAKNIVTFVTEDAIEEFFNTIDFTKLKNPMAALGQFDKAHKDLVYDKDDVRRILEEKFLKK